MKFIKGLLEEFSEFPYGTIDYPYIVLYCGRVPAANAPECTAAEGLLYKPWFLVVPTCTARYLHQRP